MAVYQAVRKFTLEVFKFSIYLAVPVGAYQFFAHPDRVKAFVDRVRLLFPRVGCFLRPAEIDVRLPMRWPIQCGASLFYFSFVRFPICLEKA